MCLWNSSVGYLFPYPFRKFSGVKFHSAEFILSIEASPSRFFFHGGRRRFESDFGLGLGPEAPFLRSRGSLFEVLGLSFVVHWSLLWSLGPPCRTKLIFREFRGRKSSKMDPQNRRFWHFSVFCDLFLVDCFRDWF